MDRYPCIKHWSELQEKEPRFYSGSQEPLSIGCALGHYFGFARIGIHHEIVEPGHRTSCPHAEKTEDEFVHVLEGTPDVWLDGVLYRLQPGDSVGFKAGDGLAHTLSTIPTRSSAYCVSETPNEKITAFTTPFILNVMRALASSTGMMCPIASWVITMVYRTDFVLTTGRSKRSRRLISRFVDTQITNLVMKRLLLA
ncbi:Hemolysin [Vibrio cholerae]|nr:Hemolysin [Vibrio cholerae]